MQVLYEDVHLIAVNKPGGLAVQADKTGDPHLLDQLSGIFPQDGHLGLPHRLDRPVSGVTIITRTHDALVAMNELFAGRQVVKIYWAVVAGSPSENGTWQHRLSHDQRRHKASVTDDASVALSTTGFRTLARGERYSLIELVPEAGRFHQLRAQCAAEGFPIKGDVKYGARRGEQDRTIALHARSLAFAHPISALALRIEAPAPDKSIWTAMLNIASSGGVVPS